MFDMNGNRNDLFVKVAAAAPILGVAYTDPDNKATWSIVYRPEATAQQRTAAQAVLDGYDPVAVAARFAAFAAAPEQTDLYSRLRTATADQIDAWLLANVTNLAQARTVLAAIIKLLVAHNLV